MEEENGSHRLIKRKKRTKGGRFKEVRDNVKHLQ